jgi:ADP-ribosylglycohydrolase
LGSWRKEQLLKGTTMDIDKAKGILYGLAIGDALGYPTEFLRLPQIKAKYGPEGITDLPSPALFTDDTQMSIAVAEALFRSGDRDLESFMAAVREEFIKWYHSPENNRAPGNTCLRGVARFEEGIPWRESGDPRSKGCGSAMRVAPIGYLYQHHPEKLREVASASGICTHRHPTADAASVGAAYLVKLALDGLAPEKMVPELLHFTAGISDEWERAISKVQNCLGWEDEEKALRSLGEGWVGEEAVALALYCFLRYPEDYKKTVLRGANTNGDSDSVACIAGSISGAYLGAEAIPKQWVRKIEKSDYLADLARRLAVMVARFTAGIQQSGSGPS